MNKHGFTLMEVLAVVLILAVIASLTIPGIRDARFEARHSQAKLAAKKLITGIRNYRVTSRGGDVSAGTLTGNAGNTFDTVCNAQNTKTTGIPAHAGTMTLAQLAPCGFVDARDFKDLPYTFYYGSSIPSGIKTSIESKITQESDKPVELVVQGTNQKAGKYANTTKYAIYIDQRLVPLEYEK